VKKKHPEHVNLERWLVSYADFITLLFAFFVVMYAISQADIAKFKKVSASLKAAFSAAGPVGMIDLGGNSGGSTARPFETEDVPGGRVHNLPAGKTNTAADPDPQLQEVRELLEETISLELGVTDLSDKMQMLFDSRGLVVRLAAKDFFDPGGDEVRPDLRPMIDRIGRVIARTRRLVRIEGHTDPSEGRTEAYASGWELSAARAAWVAKYWLKRFDIAPRRLGIAGFAHHRPLSESGDEWGRATNRRVEIIILNNQYESP
jgi:chemotaxis protein MotB